MPAKRKKKRKQKRKNRKKKKKQNLINPETSRAVHIPTNVNLGFKEGLSEDLCCRNGEREQISE